MIVLKIIGWVLLGILALILLVLCIRIRIAAEYSDDNTNVRLEWLFLKLPLYPRLQELLASYQYYHPLDIQEL